MRRRAGHHDLTAEAVIALVRAMRVHYPAKCYWNLNSPTRLALRWTEWWVRCAILERD